MDGRLAGSDHEKPLEHVGDPPRAVLGMRFFEVHHLPPDLCRLPGPAAGAPLRFQPLGSVASIGLYPAMDGMGADAELLFEHGSAVSFLQKKPHHPKPELDRVGQGPRRTLFCRSSALLFFLVVMGSTPLCVNWFLHSGVSPHFLSLEVP